jgi:hypothetical protein
VATHSSKQLLPLRFLHICETGDISLNSQHV